MRILLLCSLFLLTYCDSSPPEPQTRQEVVENEFSGWDGSHPGLTQHIKNKMNDPDSYEHVETRFKDEGETILVVTKFRGNNAFGGKVVNEIVARVGFENNVLEIIE